MSFGMGPAGWAYVSPYAYPYASPTYPVWPWWGGRRGGWGRGWGRGRGRGFGWHWFAPYWYPWW
jgi:hypothetical protein